MSKAASTLAEANTKYKVSRSSPKDGNLVTDNLDLWSSALLTRSTVGRGSNGKLEAYGIKKLRELILELAVRGKLVPQDPNDEPASVLLERIAKEKARLVKEGKIKKQKPLAEIANEERPYVLPSGWDWERLGNLFDIQDSRRIPVNSSERASRDGPYPYYGANGQVGFIDDYLFEGERVLVAEDGGFFGDPIRGVAYVVDGKFWVNNHAHVLACLCKTNAKYWVSYLNRLNWQPLVRGMTRDKLNQTAMAQIMMAVPPLAEQNRIAAKVDELMALCDQLEQQQTHSLEVHQTLVETLLGTLTSVESAEVLAESWARIADHFDTLFTTEHSIDRLKQTILQLAIMGKLVPQDPNDEPASVLLQRFAKQKERMIEQGTLKKDKPLPAVKEDGKPFQLPAGWVWSRLPEIGELARGKSKHRPRNDPKLYSGGTIPMVQTGDVSRAEPLIATHSALYNRTGLNQSRLWPKGTMCITIAANIADTGILAFDACFPDSVVGFIPFDAGIDVKYFEYFMRTAKSHLEDFAPSTAQKNINLGILGELLVPLPPASELGRVVAKVDELMALCDALKARIKDVQTTQIHLADAIVEQAVA